MTVLVVIDGIEKHSGPLSLVVDSLVDRAILGRRDSQERALQIAVAVLAPDEFNGPGRLQLAKSGGEFGSNDDDRSFRIEQAPCLVLADLAAADHYTAAPGK